MLQLVEVTGKDAAEFLHRVTAGPIRGREQGHGALLNGQSRVLAQFDFKRDGSRFLLASPDECAAALAEGLEALHFSEDLSIVQAGKAHLSPGEGWASAVPGYEIVEGTGSVPSNFHFDRVGALVPWPGLEWVLGGSTPALEAGMLPWIDRHKGCYPGQEVVELSLNVGHPARVLVALEGEGVIEGVTSEARSGNRRRVIVRLPWAKKDLLPPGFSKLGFQF